VSAVIQILPDLGAGVSAEASAAYRQFIGSMPGGELANVVSWLGQNSTAPTADFVADAVVRRRDSNGIAQMLKLVSPELPVSARSLAVRALATIPARGGNLDEETRRKAFVTLWDVRGEQELNEALWTASPLAFSDNTSLIVSQAVEFSDTAMPSLLNEALLRLLRADDQSSDWDGLMEAKVTSAPQADGSFADLLRLWVERIAFDSGQGLTVAASAAHAASILTDRSRLPNLTSSERSGSVARGLGTCPRGADP
jgi:hypothetical protein